MSLRVCLVVLMASVSLAAIGSARTVAALTPNQSIMLAKPDRAVTGTLAGGVWTRKRSLHLPHFTHAAASRDTLALYDRDTGVLRTGTFRNGVYTFVRMRTIPMRGASCVGGSRVLGGSRPSRMSSRSRTVTDPVSVVRSASSDMVESKSAESVRRVMGGRLGGSCAAHAGQVEPMVPAPDH